MPLDVLYVEGPGDIVAAFRSWRSGVAHASETSVTYSSQLFDYCVAHRRSLLAISYGPRADADSAAGIAVTNLPRRMLEVRKIGYRLSLHWYAVRIAWRLVRLRPRLVLVTSGVVRWSAARWWRLLVPRTVPILHNALWPAGQPAPGGGDVSFWRSADAPRSLAVSPAIRRQVGSIDAAAGERVVEFRPTFVAADFAAPEPKPHAERPFRVLFVGRVEANKGVFDLLDVAAALESDEPGAYRFDVCGDGTALAALARQVRERGLQDTLTLHGRLDREALIARYGDAHVCIVPTRSSFAEGFAQVVPESILALRPVVTSPVVPAAEPYAAAVEWARTDDVASYVEAVRALSRDPSRYAMRVQACRDLRPIILSVELSFRSALERLDPLVFGSAPLGSG